MSKFGDWLKTKFGSWFKQLGNELEQTFTPMGIGAHVTSWLNSQTGAHLTGAQEEANAFSAQEAQKSREWSEYMRATQYQTQVSSMQAAGVNPALMYGSAPSVSAPSGPSASSVAPSGPATLSDLMQMLLLKKNMSKIDAEVKNIDSQTEVNTAEKSRIEADTFKISQETKLIELQNEYYPKLSDAQITKINAEVSKLEAEVPYLQAATSKESAEVGFINAQKLLTQKNTEWVDKLNNANIEKMSAESKRAMAEAVWTQFQHAYAAAYNTTIPSGGVTAIISYLTSTLNVDNSFINAFLDAIRNSGRVDVNTHTTNNVQLPTDSGVYLPSDR